LPAASEWIHALLTLLITPQKDNVSNQREHLILLLANVHIRQIPKPDQQPKVHPSIDTMLTHEVLDAFVVVAFTPFLAGKFCSQLDDRALDTVMKKLFKNYKRWCKYLGRKSSLWYDALMVP
jgi:callose synthase